jgi:hypothetical protein
MLCEGYAVSARRHNATICEFCRVRAQRLEAVTPVRLVTMVSSEAITVKSIFLVSA